MRDNKIERKWIEPTRGVSEKLAKSKYITSQIKSEKSWALFKPATNKYKNAKIKSQTVSEQL